MSSVFWAAHPAYQQQNLAERLNWDLQQISLQFRMLIALQPCGHVLSCLFWRIGTPRCGNTNPVSKIRIQPSRSPDLLVDQRLKEPTNWVCLKNPNPKWSIFSRKLLDFWVQLNVASHPYCWWLKSQTTTWDVWNPINNGENYRAGFQPSTVLQSRSLYSKQEWTVDIGNMQTSDSTASPCSQVHLCRGLLPDRSIDAEDEERLFTNLANASRHNW